MDPIMGLGAGFESIPALASAIAVLVAVWLVVERMVGNAFGAADSIRGRDHCHFCGAVLPSRGGLGHESRCRTCEHDQPWG
ncbi:hypothetical protein BH24ACT26_BH24ACT26_02430 [soil metagenome]